MQKILLNNRKNFYKGNMHCHSTKSDGKLTPEQLKEVYKSNGYSFLAITDHEIIYDNSYLDDKDFITITSAEYAFKEFPKESTLKNFNMRVAHFNVYAKDQSNADNFFFNPIYAHHTDDKTVEEMFKKWGSCDREYSPEGINSFIKRFNENGFFVAYNHSRWSLETHKQYSEYDGVWGVEIYNNECNFIGLYEYDINVFDDFLRDGKRVFATSGDDNHNKNGISDSFGTFVMVNAESLSYKNIINALLKGDFYTSTGPTIESLVVEDNKVKIKCSNAKKITYSTFGRRTRCEYAEDGYINSAEFEIKDTDVYFRLDVIDEYGKRANTQSYFVK